MRNSIYSVRDERGSVYRGGAVVKKIVFGGILDKRRRRHNKGRFVQGPRRCIPTHTVQVQIVEVKDHSYIQLGSSSVYFCFSDFVCVPVIFID